MNHSILILINLFCPPKTNVLKVWDESEDTPNAITQFPSQSGFVDNVGHPKL